MGYTVPVVVRKGDEVKTIGFADVETVQDPFTVVITDEQYKRLIQQPLNLSIYHGDVDIEEISIVVNDNKENSEC